MDCGATKATTLEGLTWQGWDSPTATATGKLVEFACESADCAAGHWTTSDVKVVATGVQGGSYSIMKYSLPQTNPVISGGWALTVGGPVHTNAF